MPEGALIRWGTEGDPAPSSSGSRRLLCSPEGVRELVGAKRSQGCQTVLQLGIRRHHSCPRAAGPGKGHVPSRLHNCESRRLAFDLVSFTFKSSSPRTDCKEGLFSCNIEQGPVEKPLARRDVYTENCSMKLGATRGRLQSPLARGADVDHYITPRFSRTGPHVPTTTARWRCRPRSRRLRAGRSRENLT